MYGVGGYWAYGWSYVHDNVPINCQGIFFVYHNTTIHSHTALQSTRGSIMDYHAGYSTGVPGGCHAGGWSDGFYVGNPAAHTSPVMYSTTVKVTTYYGLDTGMFAASLWSWFHQPQWDSNTNYGVCLGKGIVVNTHGLHSFNSWHYNGTSPVALGTRPNHRLSFTQETLW